MGNIFDSEFDFEMKKKLLDSVTSPENNKNISYNKKKSNIKLRDQIKKGIVADYNE